MRCHSVSDSPYNSKSNRIAAESQADVWRRMGTRMLNALSLRTVRLAMRASSLILGDGDRESVAVVDMQHHVHVGAAVADVDDAIGPTAEPDSSSSSTATLP